MENPRRPHERSHLLTPKLPKIYINRFNRETGSKYPKLWCIPCRRDTHLCQHRVWAPLHFGAIKSKFWEDVVALRLMRTRTQQHDHTTASQHHQSIVSRRREATTPHQFNIVVASSFNCSRGGSPLLPMACADSEILRVSGT